MRRGSGAALALLAGLLLPLLPGVSFADPVRPDPGRPFFGPHLPYPDDTPAAYVDRLGGLEPSTYTLPIPYPLDTGAISQLTQYAELVAERGAVLIVDVQPAVRLQQLDDAGVAGRLAGTLAHLHTTYDSHVLLRFAPEMNGSWETWGQQPGAYVRAFRTLAEAMDRVEQAQSSGDDWSEMVWAPVYGSGYPFRRPDREGGANGALQQVIRSERGRTDTNRDGRLDTSDDPYAPYYPGDRWVDWVGLSMYRLGQSQGVRRNHVSPATEFRQRLEERWGYGYGGPSRSFYDRYAVAHDRPMLVETAAFFNPGDPGPTELRVKSAWWRQVFGVLRDYPKIGGFSWLEVARTEPEALQAEPVDWRVTATPRLAAAFARDLGRAPLTLGPVLDPYVAPSRQAGPGAGAGADDHSNAPAAARLALSSSWELTWWLVVSSVLLLLSLLVGAALPRWRRRGVIGRDERLDLLRGGVLVGLVLTLLLVTGLRAWWPADPIAVWTGAGLLLLVSGASHGLRYREVVASGSPWVGTVTRWRRARTVYVVALLTAVLALLIDALPGVATDLDTYAHSGALLDYPPPAYAFWDLLSLDAAPWIVGALGLVAVLVAVSPVFLWLLHRGWWWAPLGVSWAVFLVWADTGAAILPLASEATLPVLAWQLPFVHGLVLGHQSDAVERRAPLVVGLVAAGSVALSGLVLSDLVLDSGTLERVLFAFALGCVMAAAVALVATAWVPLRLLLGWLLLPIGRRPLLVVPFTVGAVVVSDVLTR